jgi:hypothetical protein
VVFIFATLDKDRRMGNSHSRIVMKSYRISRTATN